MKLFHITIGLREVCLPNPLLSFEPFFSDATLIFFVASACLFPCGYRGVDLLSLLFQVEEEFLESSIDKIRAVINADFLWWSVTANYLLPKESFDVDVFDVCQGFGLYQF